MLSVNDHRLPSDFAAKAFAGSSTARALGTQWGLYHAPGLTGGVHVASASHLATSNAGKSNHSLVAMFQKYKTSARRALQLVALWPYIHCMKNPLTWDEFERVELRVGLVLDASVFEAARKPALIICVDFGPEIGTLKTSAQVTVRYSPEQLIGKKIAAVTNFPPKQIGPIRSEFLLLGALDTLNGTAVLEVPSNVAPGTRIA